MPDIERLLRPASIAVIGASDDPGRIGGRPLRILSQYGYTGSVYPVNPKYETAQGLRCYPDIASLPADVDLYIVSLPARIAVGAFEQAAEHGARSAVIFSGGFAEIGSEGRRLQERVAAIAREHDVALVGPNSLGFASLAYRTFGTFATTLETLPDLRAGDIALVSQSGGTAFNLLTEAHWAGVRFSHVIATGNEAGLTFADYLEFLAKDDATSAIIGYLEGAASGAPLGEAFEAIRGSGKPTFLVKTGASVRGSASVMSHTAQLSGDDDAFQALFDRYGIVRLETLDDAVDAARALALKSAGDGVAVASNSGGAAAYLSDACERHGVPLVDLADTTRERLTELLPEFAQIGNPLDFTPQVINDRSLLGQVLRALDQDGGADLILLFLGSMEYLAHELLEAILSTSPQLQTPLGLAWNGVAAEVRAEAARAGLLVCADPTHLVRGLGFVRQARHRLARAPGRLPPVEVAVSPSGNGAPPRELVPQPVGDGRLALDEAQVMGLLEPFGLATPRRCVAGGVDEAVSAAEAIGYPCVLKLIEPLLAHRAVAGAVRVGLNDGSEVRAAFEDFAQEFAARRVLIAEQVAADESAELIIGVVRDPVFGTRGLLGSGGVLANDADDSRTVVPPYEDVYIKGVFERLRIAERIRGIRNGRVEAFAAELARILGALAAIVEETDPEITEIECNPVLVTPTDAVVLDALAFVRESP